MGNDFYNGIIVGAVQTFVGHPFDTLKVLKQSNIKINYKILNINKLYRGLLYPLYGAGVANSIQFGSYQYINDRINNPVISGLGSGFITGFILNPIEVLKIKKQLTNTHNVKLSRGLHITCFRESLSTSIYFATYYKGLDYFDTPSSFNSFISGGAAGVFSWLAIYPVDVVKTRYQSYKTNSIMTAINMGNLWNGLTFCLLRAFIVNGSGFMVYNSLVSD
jgi:solute carrier family 25 (mitochondrial carnitine/acylcarnitine transporter), member 20/29